MTTVYIYDPATLLYQGEYAVPKGLFNDDLYPAHYSPTPPPNFDPETQQCVMQNGEWVVQSTATVSTLAEMQAQQSAALSMACQQAIIGGFTSSALGIATTYPCMLIDQSNQRAAAMVGGALQCVQGGTWALRQHTAAQATQVVTDSMTWINKCQTQLDTLTAQVNAATTAAAVEAVTWTNP